MHEVGLPYNKNIFKITLLLFEKITNDKVHLYYLHINYSIKLMV